MAQNQRLNPNPHKRAGYACAHLHLHKSRQITLQFPPAARINTTMKKYLAILTLAAAGTLPAIAAIAQDPTADELISYFEGQRIRTDIYHAARTGNEDAFYFAITEQNRRDQQQTLNAILQLAAQMNEQQR